MNDRDKIGQSPAGAGGQACGSCGSRAADSERRACSSDFGDRCLVEELSQLGTYVKEGRQLASDLAQGKLGALDEGMFADDNPLIPPLEEIQSNLARALSIVKSLSNKGADVYVGQANGYTAALEEALEKAGGDFRTTASRNVIDPLTGVGNWVAYDGLIEDMWERGVAFTAGCVDLDNLKQCNDLFGYVDGDRYIASACRQLKRIMGPGEQLFRIGGDKFVIVSVNSSEEKLSDRLEQCRTDLMVASSEAGSRAVFSFSYACLHVDPSAGATRREVSREIDSILTNYKLMNKPRDMRNVFSPGKGVPENDFIERLFEAFSRAFEGNYLFIHNIDTGESRWSRNAVRALGLGSECAMVSRAELLGRVHPSDRESISFALDRVEGGLADSVSFDFRMLDPAGACLIRQAKIVRLGGSGDESALIIGMISNVEGDCGLDGATGLPNNQQLSDCIEGMRAQGASAGFSMVKISRFAEINERYGCRMGDRVLSRVAEIMASLSRESSQLYRARGVRLVACASGVDRAAADHYAAVLAEKLAEPIEIDGVKIPLAASVSASYYHVVDRAPFALLTELDRRADVHALGDWGARGVGGASFTGIEAQDRIDALTGLSFEDEFLSRAEALRDANPEITWCMVKVDLGHMRVFNEWYGSEVGDRLIADIGTALKGLEDDGAGVAGYWGEDDFSLFAPFDGPFIDDVYLKLCAVVYGYDSAAGFRPSLGVYCLGADETVCLDQYTKALFAAHRAKHRLQNRICMFRPVEFERDQFEQEILAEFKRALSEGRLFFHLQPQCDLATGRIVGAEALARMRRADGTFIAPGDFVPVLEKSQLIDLLDQHVWRALFSWMRERMLAGKRIVPISLNVSRIDLLSFDVTDYLDTLIAHYGVPPEYVKVEITETACTLQIDDVRELVDDLKGIGVEVYMDDFGSGQSSLNMLRTIDLDAIKLDRDFLTEVSTTNEKSESVIQSVMDLSRALNIPVIVEGIETEGQAAMMRRLGAQYAQGFYFFRPMDPETFGQLIDEA